ncbi:DUF748 domain-containing protein [Pararobbsia silviterrae]|uniref:DUF748 domain-containing protein n=1 Tax=Pararobbsia silviterrae TaxID=1792498 RepID=A0A494X5W3_9BURK|nr:DUF748 domain-containing protein [Pararobbsia silviterrae]RKP45770.1 DUF748 domain-containing protein [Pararobbsia silviterrae]
MQRSPSRIGVIAWIAVVLIVIAGTLAYVWATRTVRQRILEALGPDASVEQIDVGWSSVSLRGVRLRAPSGWPAPDAFRADRIDIAPDWPAWFSHRVHLTSVEITHFYESGVRTPQGTLVVLPGLKEHVARMAQQHADDTGPDGPRAPMTIDVDRIHFSQGQFDFYDEKIASPPFAVHLDALDASISTLDFPALSSRSTIRIGARMGGGTVAIDGWIAFDTRDSAFAIRLERIDAKALAPYLLRGQKVTITSGTLDMTMDWHVQGFELHAPGRVSLANFAIAPSRDGPVDSLASIPKKAAVAALKNDQGRIDIPFALQGNLRDPHFSIEEDWSKRVSAGLAKAAGVSVDDVSKGASDAAKGIGNALKSLIGK